MKKHFLIAFITTGHVEEVYIPLLWSYELSYVIANVRGFPINPLFVVVGGYSLLFHCYIYSCAENRKRRWKTLVIVYPFLVCFSFWSFLNALEYMVLVSFKPFYYIKMITITLKISSTHFCL